MDKIKTLEIPKWGLSMEEGSISSWLISEGDAFVKGDELCEIETSKIVNALEAQFDSTLRKILAQEGETLAVGKIIAVCADSSVSDDEIANFIAGIANLDNSANSSTSDDNAADNSADEVLGNPEITAAEMPEVVQVKQDKSEIGNLDNLQNLDGVVVNSEDGGEPSTPKPTAQNSDNEAIPKALQGYQDDDSLVATPHARRTAKELDINLKAVTASHKGRITLSDIAQALEQAGSSVQLLPDKQHAAAKVKPTPKPSTLDDSKVPATPLARELATRLGVNLHDCLATASKGRVGVTDVMRAKEYFADDSAKSEQNSAPKSTTTSTPAQSAHSDEPTVIPMNAMRRTIAKRLQQAKQNAPHFRLSLDVDMTALQDLRAALNDGKDDKPKLSINDLLIKVAAHTLMQIPQVNVQFDDSKQQILQFAHADISVAVAIDGGLITPIVKAADTKGLWEISTTMKDLAARAKTGKLTPDEFMGGSFSISNLGMMGIVQFDAIINPPQGAILAIGATQMRAVVLDGAIVARPMMTVTLSCDHRVIDGALGAKFLAQFKKNAETPALMLG
ncbi:dihydrolipoamide acetyltransferase [Moraxella macacae 0408225]|uniref:Dihydrolipoamide acetyltransferase component of pyruvate dehydrogenase complex n=1 Tax=Moraxella macacae 0408225 TaxID=1230338 RepID=L2F8W4_9GAMM|nr:2-oxo acid dehydrogenase subunit E2 [Moraxella macacae]ELA09504.1 dihydrolipoamide acetyltransferase [Moraxella macacae 0408225]